MPTTILGFKVFITILEEICVQKESLLSYQKASVLVRKVFL